MQYSRKETAHRIEKERYALGYSKLKLAELLFVDRNTITAWERCDDKGRFPPLDSLLMMCELFNCELGYLLGEHECKTREATDIRAVTGLSEIALTELTNHHEASDALSRLLENGFASTLGGLEYFITEYCSEYISAERQYIALTEMHKKVNKPLGVSTPSVGDIRDHNERFDGMIEPDPDRPGVYQMKLNLDSYLHTRVNSFARLFVRNIEDIINKKLKDKIKEWRYGKHN